MKKSMLVGSLIMIMLVASSMTIFAVELEVACFPDQDSGFKAILEDFEEKYPNIDVKLKTNGFAEHHDNLLTKIAAGGDVPDVANIEVSYVGNFVEKGGFVNLLNSPYNAKQYKDNFIDYKWSQAMSHNGRLIAMPLDIAPATIFYRRDNLKKTSYQVEDLETMEDWIQAGLEFSKTGEDKFLVASAVSIYEMFARSGNYRYFNEEGECIVDSDKFVKAFTMAKKVKDLGLSAGANTWSNEWVTLFKKGNVLMEPNGAWLGGHLRNWIAPETAGKWGVTNLPNDLFVNIGGSFVGIPKDAEHKEAAWKFIKYVTTNRKPQLQQFEAANIFPTWKPAFDSPMFEKESEYFGGQKARKMWLNAARNIPEVVTSPHDSMAEDIVSSALQQVLQQDRDPKAALKQAERMIERRVRR